MLIQLQTEAMSRDYFTESIGKYLEYNEPLCVLERMEEK